MKKLFITFKYSRDKGLSLVTYKLGVMEDG